MAGFANIRDLYTAFLFCGMQVCTDTRNLIPGSMFLCLKGDRFDANNFVRQALEGGCKVVVTSHSEHAGENGVLFVEDGLSSLQQLANYHRRQFTLPVLAITGSNGKTTNKELIHAVVSRKFKTLATEGNLNNHIGVPLTLLRLRKEHEFAIIEMGANHQGEIAALCAIAEPNFGLITNIGKAHLEGFGGVEGVIKGKSEMYRYLESVSGHVFVNGDDELLLSLCKKLPQNSYGKGKNNQIIGREENPGDTLSFSYTVNGQIHPIYDHQIIETHLVGSYNLPNYLAAACVGEYFGIDRKHVSEALQEYIPNMNRSQLKPTKHNRIILDAYNANPDSMRSAIENFSRLEAPKKLVLLGDMFELGEASEEEHRKVIALLQEKKLSQVVLVGEHFGRIKLLPYPTFQNTEECKTYLKKQGITGHTILIKGSRAMQMEKLVEVL